MRCYLVLTYVTLQTSELWLALITREMSVIIDHCNLENKEDSCWWPLLPWLQGYVFVFIDLCYLDYKICMFLLTSVTLITRIWLFLLASVTLIKRICLFLSKKLYSFFGFYWLLLPVFIGLCYLDNKGDVCFYWPLLPW